MKKAKYIKIVAIALIAFSSITSFGQMTSPTDPGSDPVSEPPLGGGAPVDGGVAFLLLLGAAYGGKKMLTQKKKG